MAMTAHNAVPNKLRKTASALGNFSEASGRPENSATVLRTISQTDRASTAPPTITTLFTRPITRS